jgi:hypothetical protein
MGAGHYDWRVVKALRSWPLELQSGFEAKIDGTEVERPHDLTLTSRLQSADIVIQLLLPALKWRHKLQLL